MVLFAAMKKYSHRVAASSPSDDAIRVYDRLLLILSRESMSSGWVKTEVKKARQKEITSQRSVLFPIAVVPYGEVGEIAGQRLARGRNATDDHRADGDREHEARRERSTRIV